MHLLTHGKKGAALLCSAVLTLSLLAACGEAPSTSSAAAPSQTGASSTAPASSSAPAEKPAEPPVIVLYQNSGAGTGAGSEAGSNPEDLKMVQDYILEQTGVWLDARLAPKEGAKEKLTMLLASGEQLDLWYDNWMTYYKNGIITPLNDLLNEAPAVVNAWEPWGSWPSMTDPDGSIWGVPRMTPTTPYPVFVREDYLQQMNLSQPTTLEELEDYLYKVKALDPYGNGQTIPLITRGSNLNALEFSFVSGFVETGRGNFLDSDGKIKPLQLAPGYVDFLAKMNQWYKDGILHKENIGWDTSTVRDYIGRGAVAATATWYSDVSNFSETMRQNVPGASFGVYESGVTGPNGQKSQTISRGSTTGLLLSSKCKNPEAAISLINWMYSDWENYQTGVNGLKDVHWKYSDAENAQQNKLTVPIPKSEGGTVGYFSDCTLAIGLPMETQTTAYDADGMLNMHSLWLREHLDDFDACYEPFELNIFYNTKEQEDNIPTLGDINRIINEELAKFLTGDRPLSDYDNFIAELYGAGLDSWIEEHTRQYNQLS
ncbi:extracellular solute-binding protein [Ruminococcaceae bacterium OttesenSCG-928-L11]|nr:extracellular solute-binding protein [Ruminococcaceae bacterium OttesenSCG-928-L11]